MASPGGAGDDAAWRRRRMPNAPVPVPDGPDNCSPLARGRHSGLSRSSDRAGGTLNEACLHPTEIKPCPAATPRGHGFAWPGATHAAAQCVRHVRRRRTERACRACPRTGIARDRRCARAGGRPDVIAGPGTPAAAAPNTREGRRGAGRCRIVRSVPAGTAPRPAGGDRRQRGPPAGSRDPAPLRRDVRRARCPHRSDHGGERGSPGRVARLRAGVRSHRRTRRCRCCRCSIARRPTTLRWSAGSSPATACSSAAATRTA